MPQFSFQSLATWATADATRRFGPKPVPVETPRPYEPHSAEITRLATAPRYNRYAIAHRGFR